MTHTPGPWKGYGKWLTNIKDEDGEMIATVWNIGEDVSPHNARLIAIAPEMLRIMKEIHYVIEQEEMICPSCGVLCCSDDCELAEIIALAQAEDN